MNIKSWNKASRDYFSDIVASPFNKNVKNLLIKELRNIPNSKNKTLIDLGCGIGNLIPYTKNRFKTITEVDYSPEMIKKAKEDYGKYKNINFLVRDIKNLHNLNKFDVVVSVNSILDPSFKNLTKIFSEINKITKQGGLFLGIFPSMDSEIYTSILVKDYFLQKTKNEKKAIEKMKEEIGPEEIDYLNGIYKVYKEKYFYKVELEYLLKNSGFKILKFDKILYPWELWQPPEMKWFKNKEKPWDWLVVAKKL